MIDPRLVELRRRLGRDVVEQRSARQVGAHERRFAAEPRRDQGVGIFLAEQHQGAAEPFDVGLVPRLPRHEILGDEPRLGRLPALDVGVRQLRLRAVHRRLEPAVDADFDEMHQRRNVIGHARDEFLQDGGGARPVRRGDRGRGGELDDDEPGLRRLFGDAPSQLRDLLAARGVFLKQPPDDGEPFFELVAAKLDVGDGQQQHGIARGGLGGEVFGGGREIAAGDERPGELRRQLGVARVEGRRLAQRRERFVDAAGRFERGRDHPELLDAGRVLTRPGVVAGGEVHVHQLLADLVVFRVQLRRFVEHFECFGLAALVGQLAGNLLEVAEGAALVAHLDARARGGQAPFVVFRIERAEPDLRLQGAAHVPLALAQFDQRVEVGTRVRVLTLAAEDLGDLYQRVLVIRLELEDLLVDGGGLGAGAFVVEAVGDLAVLRDGLLDLSGARVEIAERVGEVPVAGLILDQAHVLRDGVGQLALADQFLGVTKRGGAINRHSNSLPSSVVSLGGRSSVNRIKQRCGAERSAMHVGVAEPRDGFEVIGGGVALVTIEPVARIAAVEVEHLAVPRDLGDDRRGGNGRAAPVAVQHTALRHRQIRDAERVDQHDVGQRRELQHGTLHRAQRRLMDVDAVDFGRVGLADGPGDRGAQDLIVKTFAFGRRHRLRIADAWNVAVGMEHHRRGDDGPGQTAAPNLVAAGDVHESDATKRILEGARRRNPGHFRFQNSDFRFSNPLVLRSYDFAMSFILAALPFRSRR